MGAVSRPVGVAPLWSPRCGRGTGRGLTGVGFLREGAGGADLTPGAPLQHLERGCSARTGAAVRMGVFPSPRGRGGLGFPLSRE